MQFKLALFALSSLVFLTAASPFERRASVCTRGVAQCCVSVEPPSDPNIAAALNAAGVRPTGGYIGVNCRAAVEGTDPDEICGDEDEVDNSTLACCDRRQTNAEYFVGCIELEP